jgi:hypothetical protein
MRCARATTWVLRGSSESLAAAVSLHAVPEGVVVSMSAINATGRVTVQLAGSAVADGGE